jgi:hypothetical protein
MVSANNPFAKCSVTNLVADGSKLEYDIVCPEEVPQEVTPYTSFRPTRSLVASRW